MVKEFEFTPAADVWVLLDLDAAWHVGEGMHSTEEYAVTAAASLAAHFLHAGRSVGLVASARQQQAIPPDRGDRQLTRILETLALVKANGRIPLHSLLSSERSRLQRTATVLAVTPSTDQRWAGALAQIRQSGIHAAAVLVEGSTFAPVAPATMQVATLTSGGVPTHLIKRSASIREAIATGLAQGLSGTGRLRGGRG